jgi:hypothetical protein
MLRLIVSDYAILRVASPPPTLPVMDFRPVREYGTAIGTWLLLYNLNFYFYWFLPALDLHLKRK